MFICIFPGKIVYIENFFKENVFGKNIFHQTKHSLCAIVNGHQICWYNIILRWVFWDFRINFFVGADQLLLGFYNLNAIFWNFLFHLINWCFWNRTIVCSYSIPLSFGLFFINWHDGLILLFLLVWCHRSLGLNTFTLAGAGFLFVAWNMNKALDSCVDHILGLDGTRMQQELNRM